MSAIQQVLAGISGGDPYFSSVKLLLHMSGTDASTTFTDQIGHTFTANGNAQIDTAQSKFGGASALFDGTGDWIDTPDSADYVLGSGDATCEFWMRTNGAITDKTVCGQYPTSALASDASFQFYINATGKMLVQCGVGAVFKTVTGTTSVNNTAWHHIAFVIYSGALYLYIDGVSEGTPVALGAAVNNSPNKLAIGISGEYTAVPFNGWIDEFRLTVGVARYTANFTPPTTAFQDA